MPRKLIVELDGGQHAKQEAYDEKRDTFLKDKGYRILRIWNNEVFENCFGVLESIYNALPHHPPLEGGSKDASLSGRGSPPPPQPSPAGSVSATPPPGGSEWTPERAHAYLDSMDDNIAALFPDSFEDSELGKIPKGWEVKSLDSIASFLNGLPLRKYPVNDGTPAIAVIKIAQLRTGHIRGADLASSELPSQYVVHDGDVLFSWSGSLVLDIWSGGDGALNQHLFKVTSTEYPKWLYYHWIREHLPGFCEIAAGKVTTMGHIQRSHLSEAATVIPNSAMLEKVNRYMQALLERSLSLRVESQILNALRNTLLPKLLSGEIHLRESKKATEVVI